MSVYQVLKIRVHESAEIAAELSDEEAAGQGFRDVYDFLLSDSADSNLYVFLISITKQLTVEERKALLNGLAADYAGADDWLTFSDRAKRRDRSATGCHVQH